MDQLLIVYILEYYMAWYILNIEIKNFKNNAVYYIKVHYLFGISYDIDSSELYKVSVFITDI